jgi:hypothetical protein
MEEDVLAGAQDAKHRSAEPVPNRYPGEDAGQPVPAHLKIFRKYSEVATPVLPAQAGQWWHASSSFAVCSQPGTGAP